MLSISRTSQKCPIDYGKPPSECDLMDPQKKHNRMSTLDGYGIWW